MTTSQAKFVLVVEDEPDIREVLIDKLTVEGFDARGAKDGEEGLAQALKEHPDLILLDILMPKKDGMAVLKDLRQDAWGRDVPVILLTNLSATEQKLIKGLIEDEPSYYLVKSDWKIEEVIKKVRELTEEE